MACDRMLKHGPCPFVDQGDGRCSCRMTKQTLAQAFDFCLGGRHFACETYHTLSWERQAEHDEPETKLQPGTTTPLPQLTPTREHQPGRLPRPAAQQADQADRNQAVA